MFNTLSMLVAIVLTTSLEMEGCLGKDYTNKNTIQNETTQRRNEQHISQNNVIEKRDVDSTDETCVLELHQSSINKFRHYVWYSQANFVYLNLLPEPDVHIVGSKLIVGEKLWTWTYFGKDGGLEFLKWPIEFGIWSIDLLSSEVIKVPMVMKLKRTSGNCSNLEVGITETDDIISNALVNLTEEMMRIEPAKEKYASSFFCYKQRIFIQPHYLYVLCKHIVCPFEALKYKCCSYFYNTTSQKRNMMCTGRFRDFEFEYEPFSWILPVVVSILLFAFSPIFILYCFHLISDKTSGNKRRLLRNERQNESDIENLEDVVVLDEHFPVTLHQTLCIPVKQCCLALYYRMSLSCKLRCNRLIRVFIPVFSLIIIGLQVCLDYWYLYGFVVTSVNKGVPMGFRSVIAGYEASKTNFLQVFGGPYNAICLYIFVTCILLVCPISVSDLLLLGVETDNVDEIYSPLCMKLKNIEIYGSDAIKARHGYHVLYKVLLAKFFMVINIKFWKHAINVQYKRWQIFFKCKYCITLLPFYVLVCTLELTLCIIVYGLPMLSFGLAILKSYYLGLCSLFPETQHNYFTKLLSCLLTVVLIASVILFLFMFCTIFMDASLFLTRVAIFTFTGIVVYPKLAYGYIIFTLTVIYYISQSVHDYSLLYQSLLKDTITTCESLQRANDAGSLLVKVDGFKGITNSLFEHVIERHFPKRKQVFVSLMKVCIILTILGFSINILTEMDGFKELHVIVHVGTALFICALPQMTKSVCRNSGEKFKRKRFRKELEHTVEAYIRHQQNQNAITEIFCEL